MDLKDYVCDIVNILILTRCDLTSECKVLTPSSETHHNRVENRKWWKYKTDKWRYFIFLLQLRAPHNMDLVVIKSVPASLLRIRQISF